MNYFKKEYAWISHNCKNAARSGKFSREPAFKVPRFTVEHFADNERCLSACRKSHIIRNYLLITPSPSKRHWCTHVTGKKLHGPSFSCVCCYRAKWESTQQHLVKLTKHFVNGARILVGQECVSHIWWLICVYACMTALKPSANYYNFERSDVTLRFRW